VRKSLWREWKGSPYVVPALSFWECPACGEQLFDPAAMRKIESRRPRDIKAEKQARGRVLARCPSCGSNRIRRCRRDWRGTFKGEPYFVPGIEFYKCPACREEFFDRTAVRRIAAFSLIAWEVFSTK
jgi:YgiT-type zinc finger domain-containing protein